jgi:V8-like Glu-specific endopeptidase
VVSSVLIGLVFGCNAETDRDTDRGDVAGAVALERQPLIAGTPTNAHPEVGQYISPLGVGCTATMISSKFFVMAAHCVGYASRLIGGTLTLTAATGSVSQNVNFAFAFGGDPNLWTSHGCPSSQAEYCSTGAGEFDIALGELVAPMPASNWTPATMALDEPAAGQVVTVFGYGCTKPDLTAPARTSRTFTWPNSPGILCPGDSGGPVIRNSDQKIVAINSAGDRMTDVYADLPAYVVRIHAMMDQLDGWTIGLDRFGGDLINVGAPDVLACKLACMETRGCRAATWLSNNSTCYMKSSIPDTVPSATASTFVLDPAYSLWGAFDLPDSDLAQLKQSTPYMCEQACVTRSDCFAATFVNSTRVCWLKFSIPAVSTTTKCATAHDCVSFMKKTSEAGDHWGQDYFNQSVPDEATCASNCMKSTACQAYAFTPNATCYYKRPAPQSTSAAGTRSAVRRGVFYNTLGTGISPYSQVNVTGPLSTLCSNLCNGDSNCKAWSLRTLMSQGGNNTCQLFNSIPALTTEFGSMSGLKGVEFLP